MTTVDFSQLISDQAIQKLEEDVSYKLIEDGEYEVVVTGAELKTSANGNDYINLELTLDGGNRKQWLKLMFGISDESTAITLKNIRTLGVDVAELSKVQADPAEIFIGKRAVARIETRTKYNDADKQENYVRWINESSLPAEENVVAANTNTAAPKSPF